MTLEYVLIVKIQSKDLHKTTSGHLVFFPTFSCDRELADENDFLFD